MQKTIEVTLESLNDLARSGWNFVVHGDRHVHGVTEYDLEFNTPATLFSFVEMLEHRANVKGWRLRDPIENMYDSCVLVITV